MTHTTLHSRPRLAAAMLWGIPYLALLDAGLAFVASDWRPNGTIETFILVMLAIWALSSLLYLAPAFRRRTGPLWGELALLFSVTLVGLGMLEIAASHVERTLRPDAPFHTRGRNIHQTFEPDPQYLPGIHDPSHFRTGPDGLRAAAPPAPGQARVVCVGGSTTECVYLDDTETWAALLPQYLDASQTDHLWVGNAGISGFDSQDHERFLETSPVLSGVKAVIIQPGINDLWRYLANEVTAMDYGRFEAREIRHEEVAVEPYRPWWTRSRIIQLYHTWRQPPPPPVQREGIGGREYEIRRDRRRNAVVTDELPPLQAGLDAYRAHILAMIAATRARGVPVLFTTQAVLWQPALPDEAAARCWFGWLPDGRYLSIPALRRAMDAYNAELLETCATAGVPCVDLSPLHGNPQWFYDDCHFTEAGAIEVAKRVAPELARTLAADGN